MTSDPDGEEQGLIELPLAQPSGMQGDGDDEIQIIERRKPVDHQTGQWCCQGDLPPILEEADGIPEGRKIGKQGPGPGIGGRSFRTGLTDMTRTVGRGDRRAKGKITTGTTGTGQGCNGSPAAGTEKGDRIIRQRSATASAFNRQ